MKMITLKVVTHKRQYTEVNVLGEFSYQYVGFDLYYDHPSYNLVLRCVRNDIYESMYYKGRL